MREILFRGKRKDTGEWVYGGFTMFHGCNPPKPMIVVFEECAPLFVIPETVGQYTGLNDKNGVKIFEGDIVKTTNTGNIGKWTVYWEADHNIYGIRVPAFCLKDKNNAANSFFEGNSEVIGNIHDNPGLMEGK
jgi:hypothetical protein